MSAPITRGELNDELTSLRSEIHQAIAPLATKAELHELREDMKAELHELREDMKALATKAELHELREDMKALATKAELHELREDMKALATKAELHELREDMKALATKAELELWGGALLERMQEMVHTEMARHARAFHEWTQSMITSFDDKYRSLPPRVDALESAVFRNEPR